MGVLLQYKYLWALCFFVWLLQKCTNNSDLVHFSPRCLDTAHVHMARQHEEEEKDTDREKFCAKDILHKLWQNKTMKTPGFGSQFGGNISWEMLKMLLLYIQIASVT